MFSPRSIALFCLLTSAVAPQRANGKTAIQSATYNTTENWTTDYQTDYQNSTDRAFSVNEPENQQHDSESKKSGSIEEAPTISICCEPGKYYRKSNCYENKSVPASEMIFPVFWDSNLEISSKKPEDFVWKYGYPCKNGSYELSAEPPFNDLYHLLEDGTIVQPNDPDYTDLTPNEYCLASIMTESGTKHSVLVCFRDTNLEKDRSFAFSIYPIIMLLSTIFLFATFVVYSIIPELKTMHGHTLRCYVVCLFVSYIGLSIVQLTSGTNFVDDHPSLCKLLAFIIHFSFLSSFFWLNVMCFDIWWTFGGFRSMQGTVKQREKKKFIIYSIYAWGSASLLTGVCVIMDFVPGIPKTFIRPEFGTGSCWFISESAKALYFYGPIGVTVMCNICLFISTTVKIIQHKKDTAHHLKGTDSQRHDDNKQWFNLYLKLFIVMGINWSMEIISWLFKDSPQYVWYITDLANTLQGVIIFIIFVWKDKTKRLLLKRLGCQNSSFQSRNSTRSGYHSSASRTCTTTAVMAPLQETNNIFNERRKPNTDESDGL